MKSPITQQEEHPNSQADGFYSLEDASASMPKIESGSTTNSQTVEWVAPTKGEEGPWMEDPSNLSDEQINIPCYPNIGSV